MNSYRNCYHKYAAESGLSICLTPVPMGELGASDHCSVVSLFDLLEYVSELAGLAEGPGLTTSL